MVEVYILAHTHTSSCKPLSDFEFDIPVSFVLWKYGLLATSLWPVAKKIRVMAYGLKIL
jgi:hypothetical protein